MLDCLDEKGFFRSHVARCPEHEIYRLAGPIHRAIQVHLFAANLQIGLVNTP